MSANYAHVGSNDVTANASLLSLLVHFRTTVALPFAGLGVGAPFRDCRSSTRGGDHDSWVERRNV